MPNELTETADQVYVPNSALVTYLGDDVKEGITYECYLLRRKPYPAWEFKLTWYGYWVRADYHQALSPQANRWAGGWYDHSAWLDGKSLMVWVPEGNDPLRTSLEPMLYATPPPPVDVKKLLADMDAEDAELKSKLSDVGMGDLEPATDLAVKYMATFRPDLARWHPYNPTDFANMGETRKAAEQTVAWNKWATRREVKPIPDLTPSWVTFTDWRKAATLRRLPWVPQSWYTL